MLDSLVDPLLSVYHDCMERKQEKTHGNTHVKNRENSCCYGMITEREKKISSGKIWNLRFLFTM